MLVDDDPLMHRLCQPHIERAGYEVFGAMDGGEAVQLACREPPLVVVMDMMMPEVDGLAAMLALKKAEMVVQFNCTPGAGVQKYDPIRSGSLQFSKNPIKSSGVGLATLSRIHLQIQRNNSFSMLERQVELPLVFWRNKEVRSFSE